jgi:hypothetical protein
LNERLKKGLLWALGLQAVPWIGIGICIVVLSFDGSDKAHDLFNNNLSGIFRLLEFLVPLVGIFFWVPVFSGWVKRLGLSVVYVGLIWTLNIGSMVWFNEDSTWQSRYNQLEALKNHDYIAHLEKTDLDLAYYAKELTASKTGDLEGLCGQQPGPGLDMTNVRNFLMASFTKPTYVKGYKFFFRLSQPHAQTPYLDFCENTDPDTGNIADEFHLALRGNDPVVTFTGEKSYFGLMPNRAFEIFLGRTSSSESDDLYQGPPVYLTRIEIIFSKGPVFVPTLPLRQIDERYVRGRTKWTFDAKDLKAQANLQDEVLENLIYWGLRGNAQADNWFQGFYYEDEGAEWLADLKGWYAESKKKIKVHG